VDTLGDVGAEQRASPPRSRRAHRRFHEAFHGNMLSLRVYYVKRNMLPLRTGYANRGRNDLRLSTLWLCVGKEDFGASGALP
jgi:hypothetical protein